MNLYIRIKDGQPLEHPILGENFVQAFPDVDVNNLPPEFARFERVDAPEQGVYEKLRLEYEQGADGVYRDTWYCVPMTPEEIKAKQDSVKADWAASVGYISWIFDAETCTFYPPVPRPSDGKIYTWDEAMVSWREVITDPNLE